MATFGVTSQPASGFFFDDFGNSQFWSGYGNFPGGIITDINVYAAGDGGSATCKFVIWDGSGNILYQSGNVTFGSGSQSIGGQAWQRLNGLSVFIPPTTSMSMGFWTSGHVVWTYGPNGGVSFQRTASPANQSGAGTEGAGYLATYIDYNPGVAWVNTGTPGSPIWTPSGIWVNTGTPASPIWTPASEVDVNTGTPGSPIWTPGG